MRNREVLKHRREGTLARQSMKQLGADAQTIGGQRTWVAICRSAQREVAAMACTPCLSNGNHGRAGDVNSSVLTAPRQAASNRLVRCESKGCSCVPPSRGRRVVRTGRVLEKARTRAATLFSPPDLARNPFIFHIKLTAQKRANRWRELCFYTNGWPDLH